MIQHQAFELLPSVGGLRSLLPPSTAVEETDSDLASLPLWPEEQACVIGAVDYRRREFTTVRHCARTALARLGHHPVPILPGPGRAPVWPEGIVGSMTHCAGYRAAALAWARQTCAMGIDAELNESLPEGVFDLVTVEYERRMLCDLRTQEPHLAWDRLLFSAKESIYKAWYPLTRSWLEFTQCEVTMGAKIFTGRFLVPGPYIDGTRAESVSGRWTAHGRHVLTAVCIAAPATPAPEATR